MSPYDIAFYIHIGGLFLAGGGILYADSLAWSWFRGSRETLPLRHLKRAHYAVLTALCLIIASGLYMFWPISSYLLRQPLFLLKMGFVAVLIVNSFVIGEFMHVALRRPYRSLSRREKLPLAISGATSLLCWVGAGATALVFFS